MRTTPFIINAFGGIRPRVPWHLLEQTEATIAHNVKLRNHKIEAWRERKPIGMSVQDAKSFYYKGCCLLSWDTCVDVAEYVTDYGRLFVTGRIGAPETLLVSDDCSQTYYLLGVPRPQTAPVVAHTEQFGRNAAERSYMYTYVNLFGEESAPSPASVSITVADGSAVTVSGWDQPPDGYGIKEIHIYRTATAFREFESKEQEMLTDFLKVAEVPVGTTTYTDTLLDRHLGPVNFTREVRMPPQDLREIRYLRGTGVLTGVTGNEVHFSQPYQPYNWPAEHDLTLPYNIVHAVVVDDTVIVSTDGYPYVIDGGPSCEPRKCRSVDDGDYPLPDIACGYANSAISTPFGMIYSSGDGLVLVAKNAQYQIITSPWFSTEDWVKIRPDTVRLAYWRGYIVCVTDVVSFMLEINESLYNDFNQGVLTTISDKPVDMILSSNGELLMLDDDRIVYQWNAGDTLRDYIWESREFSFSGVSSPNSGKLRTQGTLFKLLTPNSDLAYGRFVYNDEPFRLGRLGRHFNYRVGFYGTGNVDYVEIGTSYLTVNGGS